MPMSEKRKEFLIKEISKLHRKGMSNGMIAAELDCSCAFINKHTKEEDIIFKVGLQADDFISRVKKYDELRSKKITVREALRQISMDAQTRRKYKKWYEEGGRDRIISEIMRTYKKSKRPNTDRQSEQIYAEYLEYLPYWNYALYGKSLQSHAA